MEHEAERESVEVETVIADPPMFSVSDQDEPDETASASSTEEEDAGQEEKQDAAEGETDADTPAAEAPEGDEEPTEAPPEGAPETPEKEKKRDRTLEGRKAELKALLGQKKQVKEYEQEVSELKARLAALESAPSVPAAKDQQPAGLPPKPKHEDFTDEFGDVDLAAYDDARFDWEFKRRAAVASAQREQTKISSAVQAFQAREAAYLEIDPEYSTKVAQLSPVLWVKDGEQQRPRNPALNYELLHDPNGPAVSAWLAENLDVARQLVEAPPARMGRMLGEISKALEAEGPAPQKQKEQPKPSPKPIVSKAPDPLPTVGGRNATPNKSPAKMSIREYEKWRGLDSNGW